MEIKHFYLKRNEDESGVSGTGVVARGVVLPSGHCVMEWLTFTSSIAIYKNIGDVQEIHGHNGKTEIILGDPDSEQQKTSKRRTGGNSNRNSAAKS